MRRLMASIVCVLALAACKHTPPLTLDDDTYADQHKCNLVRIGIDQPLPDQPSLRSVVGDNPGDMLILSGGSQHGAFGAGFLAGWQDRIAIEAGPGADVKLPAFHVVTGISTGGLQATGAFIGDPAITVGGYTIKDEQDLLDTYIDGSALESGLGPRALLKAVRKGAISDLVYLRPRLDGILTDAVLREVAEGYRDGRRLLIGATDLDLGKAIAFDMSELANRYASVPDNHGELGEGRKSAAEQRAHLKNCYIEALVASSIVPPAAKPVFIDNRMYIDGGVRFGLFDDRIGEIIADTRRTKSVRSASVAPPGTVSSPKGPTLFTILNGKGDLGPSCVGLSDADCAALSSTSGQHEDWDVLSVAFRAVDLLKGQVQRLSVDRVGSRANSLGGTQRFVRINSAELTGDRYTFEVPGFEGRKDCLSWLAIDDRVDKPLEFHKRYMRCLIEYGRCRGLLDDWDRSTQAPRQRREDLSDDMRQAVQSCPDGLFAQDEPAGRGSKVG